MTRISDIKALVVYSSPAGTTRHVSQVIVTTLKDLEYKPEVIDVGNRDDRSNLNSSMKNVVNDYCLWIGSPVYAGHAVPPIMDFVSQLPVSKRSYAVPFITWGGVSSGIALYEMGKELSKNGYSVLGAAKILAVHSLMWQFKNPLGEGHPNSEDDSMIESLVREIDSKLLKGYLHPFPLDGLNYQPKEIQESMQRKSLEVAQQLLPLKELDEEACTQCGTCEEECPAQAIRCVPYPQFGQGCFLCYNCVRLCEAKAIKADFSQFEGVLRGMAENNAEHPLSQIFV